MVVEGRSFGTGGVGARTTRWRRIGRAGFLRRELAHDFARTRHAVGTQLIHDLVLRQSGLTHLGDAAFARRHFRLLTFLPDFLEFEGLEGGFDGGRSVVVVAFSRLHEFTALAKVLRRRLGAYRSLVTGALEGGRETEKSSRQKRRKEERQKTKRQTKKAQRQKGKSDGKREKIEGNKKKQKKQKLILLLLMFKRRTKRTNEQH